MTGHRLTPDGYMALLLERQEAYVAEHPPAQPWIIPLLEWFIREGDEDLVEMCAIDAENARQSEQPKRETKPRTFKPASHWRERLERIERELEIGVPRDRHDTTDPAAYGGIGIRETGRQTRKRHAAMDRSLQRTVELFRQRDVIRGKLHRAEAREANA